MSYAILQSNLKTILEGCARFTDPGAITEGDYRVLDQGMAEIVILEPGGIEMEEPEEAGAGFDPIRSRVWQVILLLFERFTTDAATSAGLIAMRDAVIGEIEKYPSLKDTTRMTDYLTIIADGDPQDIRDTMGQGPFFKLQVLRLRARETVYLTTGDYA